MDIIIARYKKDVSWVNQFKNSRIFIYDKSDEINDFIKLPNFGRESHTYIYHIVNNYDNLSDYCCFLQDDPFDHMGNNDLSFIETYSQPIDFYPIGSTRISWDKNGGPEYSWLEFEKLFWRKYFIDRPNELVFMMGAQFIVTRDAIRSRTKEFYEKILKEFENPDISVVPLGYGRNSGCHKFPWILEAVWPHLFNKNFKSKYDTRNILITGCGGMLGKAAHEILSKKFNVVATDIDLNEEWISYLDVRKIDEFEKYFIDGNFSIIFHLAALTDLEYCEENQENAWKTNALGAENAALMAQKYNCEIVYISTAGIFDNPNQEIFNDFDDPHPKSIYGRSKYHGEKIVQTMTPNHYVFRAGWMMGGENKDKKFIKKILNQIENGATELNVVGDKLGTPTYTHDFINNMLGVINKKQYGLYNQVCKGDCSRYDVALEMVKLLKLNIPVNLVDSDFFKNEYWAPRPYSEKLNNLKLEARGLNNMRHWKECLKEYLENYK